jgi:hypothetical protein
MQDLARICRFKATSDLPQWLNEQQRETLRNFFTESVEVSQLDGYRFQIGNRVVDFSRTVEMPETPTGVTRLIAGVLSRIASHPRAMQLFYLWNQCVNRKRLTSIL